jgi:CheY-like chemotaxis protein
MDAHLTPQLILERMPAKAAHFRIAQSTRQTREKLRILVVEDQLFSQKILLELLHHDYIVDVASGSKEGLNLYLEHAPDIAFLDIEMDGENGHTLARFLKTLDPAAYIVMVTGNNSVEDVALAKSNHVDGFVVKPYNKQKILACIETFIATRRPGKGTPS